MTLQLDEFNLGLSICTVHNTISNVFFIASYGV